MKWCARCDTVSVIRTGRFPARVPVPAAVLAFPAPCAIPLTNIPSQHPRKIFRSARKGRIGINTDRAATLRPSQVKHAAWYKGALGEPLLLPEARSGDLQ
jgi:hypothetical protein